LLGVVGRVEAGLLASPPPGLKLTADAGRFEWKAEQFWSKYFSQVRDRLLPGGLAGIQAITIQDSLLQTYRRELDFIQRCVFPGGMLPSPQLLKSLGERFGVPVTRERIFGQDYASTVASRRNNFRAT
jgi:cyclopropane-fatty-acyl-phospholipid synthase